MYVSRTMTEVKLKHGIEDMDEDVPNQNNIQYVEEDEDIDDPGEGDGGQEQMHTVVQVLQNIPIHNISDETLIEDYVIQNSDGNLTYIIQ